MSKDTTYLAIDVGRKKWGIAKSDTSKRIAFPLCILQTKAKSSLFQELQKVIEHENVERIILGVPMGNKYSEKKQAHIETLADLLHQTFQVAIDFQDERLTTARAKELLYEEQEMKKSRNKALSKEDDHLSAAAILQDYLDKENH